MLEGGSTLFPKPNGNILPYKIRIKQLGGTSKSNIVNVHDSGMASSVLSGLPSSDEHVTAAIYAIGSTDRFSAFEIVNGRLLQINRPCEMFEAKKGLKKSEFMNHGGRNKVSDIRETAPQRKQSTRYMSSNCTREVHRNTRCCSRDVNCRSPLTLLGDLTTVLESSRGNTLGGKVVQKSGRIITTVLTNVEFT